MSWLQKVRLLYDKTPLHKSLLSSVYDREVYHLANPLYPPYLATCFILSFSKTKSSFVITSPYKLFAWPLVSVLDVNQNQHTVLHINIDSEIEIMYYKPQWILSRFVTCHYSCWILLRYCTIYITYQIALEWCIIRQVFVDSAYWTPNLRNIPDIKCKIHQEKIISVCIYDLLK